MLAHAAAAAGFALWAVAWTFPLATRLATHVPGHAAGDNLAFLWNFHWMREARASPALDFFFTPALFHPLGIDLTLHSHTAFHALLGATVLGGMSLAAAQNVILVTALWLSALGAYALAWRETRSASASAVAGLVFAGAPFVTGHLLGHFNLVAAYGIPLVALAVARALRTRTAAAAALVGVLLVMTAFTDYYHAVFAAALAALLAALHLARPALVRVPDTPRIRAARRTLVALLAAVVAFAAVVALTGGFAFRAGPLSVSARGTFNLRTAAGVLAVLLALTRWRVRLRRTGVPPRDLARPAAVALLVLAAGTAPLLARAFRLWQRGEYVSQAYVWRNAPPGLDLAALPLPHAQHPVLGAWVRGWYDRFALDPVEMTPVGLVVTLLLVAAWRRGAGRGDGRWWIVGGAFLLWSLGPYLRVAGANTGVLSPQAALRYVPIVANARMPGRAVVVAQLAAAVLVALALASIADARRRRLAALAAAVLVAAEYVAAPFPTYALPASGLDEALRARTGGAVLELPLGIQDAFGTRGTFDFRTVYAQTVHRHAILGGAASRVPRTIDAAYDALPVVGALFRLSSGGPLEAEDLPRDRARAAAALAALDVRHVVLDRGRAGAPLLAYVEAVLPLSPVAREGGRELFAVRAPLPTRAR
jgi:hypothetical protein